MNNCIEINNISYKYNKGRIVFKDFSLNLNCEESTVLVGKNGSGKTTLVKIIMGIIKPQLGEIKIFNQEASNLSLGKTGEMIGYVYQYPERQLFATSVMEELTFPLIFKGKKREEVYRQAEDMIKIFDLEKVKDSYPFFLSYGEKRRLAIASVLMNKPKYLVLDEPTSSLDTERIEALSCVLDELKNKKIGMFIISHNKDFIKRHGQRVIHLEGGIIANDY